MLYWHPLFPVAALVHAAALKKRRENPLERIAREAKDAIEEVEGEAEDVLNKAGSTLDEAVQEGSHAVQDTVHPEGENHNWVNGKKKADSISIFRMMMCWGRPDLLAHKKCLNFMTDKCKDHSSGQGFCRKLFKFLKENCRKKDKRACNSADKLGLDMSGKPEEEEQDAFPNDAEEWQDSDGDGIGDNEDAFPFDPGCVEVGPNCTLAPAPAPAPAPGPMPVGDIDKRLRELPDQGYNEHSNETVMHADNETLTGDWQKEWPRSADSEKEAMLKICREHPDQMWCKYYMQTYGF